MSNRVLTSAIAAATAFTVTAAAAHAQNINLAAGDADLTMRGVAANANAGIWMDRGALNTSDSRRDLVVGAPGAGSMLGRVYVLNGGPEPSGEKLLSIANTTITGTEAGDQFGFTGALGNILTPETSLQRNIAIGAPLGMGGRGVVYVFKTNDFDDSASLTTADADFRVIGTPGDQLGSAVATADLDHDGYRELIMGAQGTGRIYIVRGGPTVSGTVNLETQPGLAYMFGAPGFGRILAAGDVTGDGFSDLVVGVPASNLVHLYRGLPAGGQLLPTFPDVSFSLAAAFDDQVGASVQVGDVDNDGIRDILIGAPLADGPGRLNSGAIHLLWGGPALTAHNPAVADVTFYGELAGDLLGSFVTAGNTNRDGVEDVVMVAPGASGGSGDVVLYYGRNRGAFGVDIGGGRRIVDLAAAGTIDRKILGLGNPALGQIRGAQIFELTGEGAGDVLAAVPAAGSNAGVVFFTKSPKFVLSSQALTFRVNDFTTVSSTLAVSNVSVVNVTWAATSNRPAWLAVSPATGHVDRIGPGPLTILASSFGMPIGTQTGTVTLRSTSKHLDMTLNISVTLIRDPLTAPTFLTATPGPGGMVLRWAPVTGAVTYTLRRIAIDGGITVAASGLTSTEWLDVSAVPAEGVWYVVTAVNASGESVQSGPLLLPWGVAGSRSPTVMAPQDFDGDGKHDITVYRASTGEWFTRRSTDASLMSRAWGAPGYRDQPVPADYDGDGKADLAVFRGATGQWFILQSADGSLASLSFGAPAQTCRCRPTTTATARPTSPSSAPRPASGSSCIGGRRDVGTWRGDAGAWRRAGPGRLRRRRQDRHRGLSRRRPAPGSSSDRRPAFTTTTWGAAASGDMPVPADYDGDGKTDSPSTGRRRASGSSPRSAGGVLSTALGPPAAGRRPGRRRLRRRRQGRHRRLPLRHR